MGDNLVSGNVPEKVGQEQIHSLLFGEKLSWQAIIYDLINTEQLDPWDINISLLSEKYLEKLRSLEEANFFVSSKVLLAAALLLRMKSEILLEEDIHNLDNVLFGKKEEKKYIQERLELGEEIPDLIARTPLPRAKKVTLEELMRALGNAITTENRRIRRVVVARQQELESALVLPKTKINLQESIRGVYGKLKEIFKERKHKLPFSELAGESVEEKIACFVPLLHLDTQHRIWLEQEGHLEEIWILLKHIYDEQHKVEREAMVKEVEEEMKNFTESLSDDEKKRLDEIEEGYENPLEDSSEEE